MVILVKLTDSFLSFFSVLRSGSAHYHCNIQAEGSTKESSVLIKNPRNELYDHARAQDAEGNECTITFLLDNQVIEIKQCTVVSI